MQIVIDITKEEYALCKKQWDTECLDTLMIAVKYGTPLPKGHGRIVDESQITGTFIWDNGYIECFAPTIIEADKE